MTHGHAARDHERAASHAAGGRPHPVGFVGLGIMGRPMARRLARSGVPLLTWTRTARADEALDTAGARAAATVAEVVSRCPITFVMLRDERVVTEMILDDPDVLAAVAPGRTLVNLGTVSPAFSTRLGHAITDHGGHYVEAPVSGSREPAELGDLVAMLAGEPEQVRRVEPLLEPMCTQTIECGPVPAASTTKLAVNVFLIASMTGLAEAFHVAEQQGVAAERLRAVLDAGQLSSPVSRAKTAKLVASDFTPQAAITDVAMNARLITDAAASAGATAPLTQLCSDLFATAVARGDGPLDMIGIVRTLAEGRRPAG